MDGQMDGRTDRRMDGQTLPSTLSPSLHGLVVDNESSNKSRNEIGHFCKQPVLRQLSFNEVFEKGNST